MRLRNKIVVPGLALLAAAALGFLFRPVSCYNGVVHVLDVAAGVRNRTVIVDGYRIHYQAEGPSDGPPVVLIHGLGSRGEDWRNLAPYLRRAGFRVYLPDLVGYGLSESPEDFSYSVHDEAEVMAHFIEALGLKPVDLGGWSMGGAIAQHIAARHPQLIRRLILFDAAGLFVLPTWDIKLFTPTTRAGIDRLDALLVPDSPKIPGFIARDIIRVSDQKAWVIHRALASMITGQDATDKLVGRLTMPVLLIWGAEDKIVPLSQGESLHRLIPQSQLDVIPHCGHLAPALCAAQMQSAVVRFLQQ